MNDECSGIHPPVQRVSIGVAQGCGDDLDAHLPCLGGRNPHGAHVQRLLCCPGDGRLALNRLA